MNREELINYYRLAMNQGSGAILTAADVQLIVQELDRYELLIDHHREHHEGNELDGTLTLARAEAAEADAERLAGAMRSVAFSLECDPDDDEWNQSVIEFHAALAAHAAHNALKDE
jgi:hypothetical protein